MYGPRRDPLSEALHGIPKRNTIAGTASAAPSTTISYMPSYRSKTPPVLMQPKVLSSQQKLTQLPASASRVQDTSPKVRGAVAGDPQSRQNLSLPPLRPPPTEVPAAVKARELLMRQQREYEREHEERKRQQKKLEQEMRIKSKADAIGKICDDDSPSPTTATTSSSSKPALPKQPAGLPGVVYTVAWMGSAGSVYECMAKTLLRRPEWQAILIDTARYDPVSNKPVRGQTPQQGSKKKASKATTSKMPSTNRVPCCNRLDDVNLFLGDKLTAEDLLYDARLTALRRRRMSSALDPSAGNGGTKCRHRPLRSDAPRSTKPMATLVNYFEGTRDLTLKARMVRTLRAYLGTKKALLDIIPETFVVNPKDSGIIDERNEFYDAAEKRYNRLVESDPTLQGRDLQLHSLWIAKSSHGCHGDDIQLFPGDPEGVDGLMRYIDKQQDHHPWVVQRYVSRPLLIEGRKFDIRYWVLLKSPYEIYLHRRGVMRTSSEPYTSNSFLAHVTNHCLQVKSKSYSKYEKGNELWHDDLEALCNKRGLQMADIEATRARKEGRKPSAPKTFQNYVMPQMKKIVVACLLSVKGRVEDPAAYGSDAACFQLFGFDFILDENLRLVLLEVNGAPGIAEKLNQIIVDDLIELVVDPQFPTLVTKKKERTAASTAQNETASSPAKSVPRSEAPSSGDSTPITVSSPVRSVPVKEGIQPKPRTNEFELIYPFDLGKADSQVDAELWSLLETKQRASKQQKW